jgi:iron complex transport system ATP-binding protein
MHALTVETVSFQYDPGIPILRDVSLAVRSGEILSIAGPNGVGKSTLLRLLDRILIPLRGRILLGTQPLTRFTRAELARRIAFVPQDGGVAFPFTVFEIVLMGRSPHIRGSAFENERDRERALEMMRLTDILHLRDQPITALSGGERQRAWIARALAQEPEILLLDEPNAHLDIAHQLEVVRILREQNRTAGLTVVSVSHDLNLAAAFSDRIAMLEHGELSALGTPTEVLTEERIRSVFGTSVLVDAHPEGGGPRVTLLSGRMTENSG